VLRKERLGKKTDAMGYEKVSPPIWIIEAASDISHDGPGFLSFGEGSQGKKKAPKKRSPEGGGNLLGGRKKPIGEECSRILRLARGEMEKRV